jgi:hypothetical protein
MEKPARIGSIGLIACPMSIMVAFQALQILCSCDLLWVGTCSKISPTSSLIPKTWVVGSCSALERSVRTFSSARLDPWTLVSLASVLLYMGTVHGCSARVSVSMILEVEAPMVLCAAMLYEIKCWK